MCDIKNYITMYIFFFLAQAEAYNNEGEKEFIKKEYQKAILQYTEGITIKCRDKELNAKLYSNRATVYYCLGE